jgi:colicin import membrane protein
MRFLALVLVLAVGPALAQDRDAATQKMLEKADQLEQQAMKALESGRKAQALELLTKAADLREEARARETKQRDQATEARRRARAEAKAREDEARAKAEAAREAMKRADARAARSMTEAERLRAKALGKPGATALETMDVALEKGDLKAAAEAGHAAHRELAQWQKRLEKREHALRRRAPKGAPGVEERVAALEKQVAALRRMLESER